MKKGRKNQTRREVGQTKGVFAYPSGGTSKKFGKAVGARAGKDSGQSNGQSENMSERIRIGGTVGITDPKSFLARRLKAGVVAFTFGTQGISPLELKTFPVNRQSVVGWQSEILGTAPAAFAIVPVFVVTWAVPRFRCMQRAAEFLADSSTVKSLPILMHSQASGTKELAGN